MVKNININNSNLNRNNYSENYSQNNLNNELNEKITIKKRAKYILIYFALRIHLINRLPSNICL